MDVELKEDGNILATIMDIQHPSHFLVRLKLRALFIQTTSLFIIIVIKDIIDIQWT